MTTQPFPYLLLPTLWAARNRARRREKGDTARVVVFGDSDFVTAGLPGNHDLFMNTIGWLSQQESLISIRPKDAADRRLTLTAAQQNNIMALSLLIIPAAVFGTGVFTWWRRR